MSIFDRPGHTTQETPAPAAGVLSHGENTQNLTMLTVILGILTLLAGIGLAAIYLDDQSWQIGLLALFFAVTGVISIFAVRFLHPRGWVIPSLFVTVFMFSIATTATAAFIKGMGLPAAVVFLVFSLMVTSMVRRELYANLFLFNGLLAAAASALLADFSPYPQISVMLIDIISPAVLAVLFMTYMVLLSMQFVTATLRIRLVTSFIAIVIIPLVILSFIQSGFTSQVQRGEVDRSLLLAAQQTAIGIDQFITSTRDSVLNASKFEVFSRYLAVDPMLRPFSNVEGEMRSTLRVLDTTVINNTVYLSSFALLDMQGNNLYDTMQERLIDELDPRVVRSLGLDIDSLIGGRDPYEGDEDYFRYAAQTGVPYISPLQIKSSTQSYFYVSAPVKNAAGSTIGVLRARYDGMVLQDLLTQYDHLLKVNSHAILLDEYNIRLADTYTPQNIYKAVAPLSDVYLNLLKDNNQLPQLPNDMLWTNFSDLDKSLNRVEPNKPVFFSTDLDSSGQENSPEEIGAVVRLQTMPWKLVYLETNFSDEALRKEQRQLTTLVTTLVSVLVAFIALGAAQVLSQPIIQLTRTAQSISRGDLDASAPMHSSDEFGMLGAAFNLMTRQLRGLIGQLEDRVRARTQEVEAKNTTLTHRAQQLNTVSQVARQIVSSQELETLLASITKLVSERFNFYHVGIFLLDEAREYAVLRAANSEGGQRMLTRHHKLPVAKMGIVGYVTGTGEPRIATDVGDDAVFFNNPDLPNTRSEMALPLKVGDQTIGALDIQSTQSNAFQEEDLELFTTLADQVAIAIYNNQLYVATLRALDEAQNLHRQYLRSQWAEDTARRKVLGYVYNQNGITAQQNENPLWKQVFNTGEPVYSVLPQPGTHQSRAVMAVPISVRGETIGVIHVQDQAEERSWSDDEIAVVNSIANQVAVAMENARLFENTIRRADRERKVLQITARIRSTNDPEEMMRIAVSELQQALHATRTQIYIRQESAETNQPGSDPDGNNGHNGHHPHADEE